MNDFISSGYLMQLRQMHEAQVFSGDSSKHDAEIFYLASQVGANSILDYGSGRGSLSPLLEQQDFDVRYYDPGVLGRDAPPEPADVIVCTDVLEHVEPDRLSSVLHHIHGLTRIAAYLVIATRPAEKRLPDGRNAHLIIDNASWWYTRINEFSWDVKCKVLANTEIVLWLRR